MVNLISLFAIILACVYSVQAVCTTNQAPSTLQVYTIDLDGPPRNRFVETSKVYRDGIINLVNAQK